MATQFPTALDSFTNPTSANTLANSTPSHSQQHANANDAIEALEAKVGVDSSGVNTSLDYRISQLEAASSGTWVDKEVPSGAIDDSNVTFTLEFTPRSGSDHVFLNGVLQNAGGNDYSIVAAVITFVTAPPAGSTLLVTYRR